MTSFGWKKKKTTIKHTLVQDTLNESGGDDEPFELDWLNLAKKRKTFQLEDAASKSKRLTEEGIRLAEEERYWEAIHRWDEALTLSPTSEKLYEMKAQALSELGELFPAIVAAEKAVECNPRWAYAYITLGRAQLNYGEIDMAIKNLLKAIHINPLMEEVMTDDLPWALQLKEERNKNECSNQARKSSMVNDQELRWKGNKGKE